ncbi:universal stress protein Slr1101-like [Montipora capricornis]|uniref:universal stress protein Slr1101-like n=1 Tax=Montipora capricornis TaxID=246305 RepID=UPI0035F1B5F1
MASSSSRPKRVVAIAVDASEHSERAFDWYKEQIFHDGDKLIVIHSHELHPPALPHAMATEEWKKEVLKHEEYIKNLEEKYKKKCEDMEVSAKIIVQGGHPGEHVCKTAKKENADMIVVGCRGMGTVRRTILGSTSDYIIHHAHRPVVVVPKVKKQCEQSGDEEN